MNRLVLLALLTLAGICLTAQVWAQTITATWDAVGPGDPSPPTGYRLLYGTAPGVHDLSKDVGLATTTQVSGLQLGVTYYFVVVAYLDGNTSPVSNEVAFTVPGQTVDPNCAVPFGSKSIQIFPTALRTTGSGGAGSRARVDFQVASPGSPVDRIAVRSGSLDLAVMVGVDLSSLAGMWFTIPSTPGTYPLLVSARNQYGCNRDQTTSYTVTAK